MTPPGRHRILMTTDAVGGVWIYASELCRALCDSGCEVMLVVMGPAPRPDQLRALRGIRGLHLKTTDLMLEWMDPDGRDLARARDALLRIADAFAPDVVHLNSFREATFAWPARVVVVAHSCVQTWWRACRGGSPDEARWDIYADRVAAGLSAADAWIAPTSAFADAITAIYRPPRQGLVIRNGLTLNMPAAAPKRPLIMAAGRLWDEAKNLKALASIAAALPWPVQVAGAFRSPDGIAAGPHVGAIHSLGTLSHAEVIAELRRAAIFVAPALYEPFGLTALEAAACGCALVLSDLPSFRELWDGAALFVDPRDPRALQSALQSLCCDEASRSRLQRAARTRARRYATAAMTQAYRRLYASIAAARRPTAHRGDAFTTELRA